MLNVSKCITSIHLNIVNVYSLQYLFEMIDYDKNSYMIYQATHNSIFPVQIIPILPSMES